MGDSHAGGEAALRWERGAPTGRRPREFQDQTPNFPPCVDCARSPYSARRSRCHFWIIESDQISREDERVDETRALSVLGRTRMLSGASLPLDGKSLILRALGIQKGWSFAELALRTDIRSSMITWRSSLLERPFRIIPRADLLSVKRMNSLFAMSLANLRMASRDAVSSNAMI